VAQEIAAQELMVHLSRYFDALKQAAELLRPAFVATYLFELAKMFNRFYEQCSIKDSEGDVRESRLALVRATARVMEHGLSVLGIEAPRRM
jgi:arginyl-tRNA synthetase